MQPDIFESKDMYRGEIRQKGIQVSRTDGVALVITSATYQIFDWDGTPMNEPAAATVDGGKVFTDIAAGNTAGGRYVEFKYIVGGWIGKARLKYRVT